VVKPLDELFHYHFPDHDSEYPFMLRLRALTIFLPSFQ